MNPEKLHITLYLTISNPGKLQPGALPHYKFDRAGGTIGCRGSNWLLTDSMHRISPVQCEIKWVEGAFCIIDRCGDTRINQSTDGIGAGHMAQLNEGDTIHIGPYNISIYFNEMENRLLDSNKSLGQYSIGDLINEDNKQLTDHVRQGENVSLSKHDSFPIHSNDLEHLASPSSTQIKAQIDPLAALDAQEERKHPPIHRVPLDPTHFGVSGTNKTQPDYAATAKEAVGRTTRQGANHTMGTDLPKTNFAEEQWLAAYNNPDSAAQHLAILPFEQGLQTNRGSMNSEDAYNLMQEVGKSIKAAVEGIMKLYGAESADQHRLSMLTRTLQPIEDNPLRLKQTYDDTVRSLFSEHRSAVHLNASSAIEESLEQAKNHNIAVIQAIAESLGALLHAFSPEILEKRFHRYNTNPNQHPQEKDDAWAWQMYQHYYNELTSSRQQGFEKLFWEVFEQAYDRAIRTRS